MARSPKRITTIRLLRALWRYRGSLVAHGDRYQEEVATAVYTALNAHIGGRVAYGAYRAAMRVMLVLTIAMGSLAAIALAVIALTVGSWWLLLGLPLVAAAIWAGFLRARWAAPMHWLEEHADTTRQVPLTELPERLRVIAQDLRGVADVPANISRELDELAGEVEREQAPHVV